MKMLISIVGVMVLAGLTFAQFTITAQIVESDASYVVPDPSNRIALAFLLNNASVIKAIGLEERELSILRETLKANQGSFRPNLAFGPLPKSREEADAVAATHLAKSEQFLDELLTPRQWERLREVAYQLEVARIGLGQSLSDGRLGKDIGVLENQKSHLLEKANKIDARVEAAIVKLTKEAQAEMMAELSPEQREKAKKLLGVPFLFRDTLGLRSSPLFAK